MKLCIHFLLTTLIISLPAIETIPYTPTEETLSTQVEPDDSITLDVPPAEELPAEPTQSKRSTMKTIGIVLGFAASVTLGLILSSKNSGKSAP